MKKLIIIIPAYNEQDRIGKTLRSYHQFFAALKQQGELDFEFVVVLNGCKDNTLGVVQEVQEVFGEDEIHILDLIEAGKGLAVIEGFKDALTRPNDYIGFVDADMATEPPYFFELIDQIGDYDGIIASRYMKGSTVKPPRPWIKEWGRKLIYNKMVKSLFGLDYEDTQCGAKLFKPELIEAIIDDMSEGQWAFDVELLYLAKKHGFRVVEVPTVWFDQEGSKLDTFGGGIKMLRRLVQLRRHHKN